jgi:hypothetical protein
MKKLLASFALSIALLSGVFLPNSNVLAQCAAEDNDDPLGIDCAGNSGLTREDPRILVGNIIQVALGLLGIIAIVIVLFAGFQWMTSAGNSEKVEGARKMLLAAVIGLGIILSSYAITDFILRNLYEATQGAGYSSNPRIR